MTQQHYRLTLSEAIAHYEKGWITATALLYYFLKIRLAPGWKMTLHQREITEKLGIPKTSFYRAVEKLSAEGLIDWDAPNGLVISVPQAELSPTNETHSHERNSVPPMEHESHQWNTSPTNGTKSPINGTTSPTNGTNTPKKPLPRKQSSAPPDSYQIFIKSLSDSAREKFLNFVREKVKNFKSPINDIEAWLAGQNQAGKERFRVYYEMFQAQVGEAVAPSQDWENHPQREEWIAQIRQGGKPSFVVQGGPREQREMRQAFADWAVAHHLVWGNQP